MIVRKFTRDWYAGYVAANPSHEDDALELLDSSGKLLKIGWDAVKWVCYLREPAHGTGSGGNEGANAERLLRRRFTGRPRIQGLWLRLTLLDGDELEGVTANDISLLNQTGIMLSPPDTRSNTQKVFVPRAAIRELSVLGVIGSATHSRPTGNRQSELFPADAEE